MTKVSLPFGEWRPDVALLDNTFASVAENVYAGPNSYIPVKGLAVAGTAALAGGTSACAGLTLARGTSGDFKIFAGTATKLWKWSGTAFTDVSRATGGAYAVSTGDRWIFQQSGTKLYAVQAADTMQVIDTDGGTNFTAAPGSPPIAAHVTQLGPHLVLSGLASNNRKLQWSAVEDNTGWTVGTNLSDEQEMPDGGPIMGVIGGEAFGYVIQDRAIRAMQYLPGDTTVIFTFSRLEREFGAIGKTAFCEAASIVYIYTETGFYALSGQQIVPIGQDAVDDWFNSNSDPARRNRVIAFVAPNKKRVMWAYHSASTATTYDCLIIYNYGVSPPRWTMARVSAQMWAAAASTSVDLDTSINAADSLLDSFEPSLDSYAYLGGRPVVAAIDQNGYLSFLDGNNLAAIIETAEVHIGEARSFVSEVYPIIDATSAMVTVSGRERLQDTATWGNAVPLEITGSASVTESHRLHRFRVTTQAGEQWTHAQGVKIEASMDGEA